MRGANIKTPQGRSNCPIAKLIPLEVSEPNVTDSVAQKDTNVVREIPEKRSQRAATQRGREKVMNWVKQLGCLPEDVVD